MKKILTIILDGFGYREETHGNAIIEAKPKNFNELWNKYPHSLLYASEEPIGLLEGQFGNSEVGHMTIGAGRKLKQDVTKIHEYLDNDIKEDEKYLNLVNKAKENNIRIHIMGLFSDGLVHSDMSHFLKLYDRLVDDGIKNIYFHLITDGRDTLPTESYKYIKVLETQIKARKTGSIATLCGRYYAMDRDNKIDRTKIYYNLITKGKGALSKNSESAINACYKKNVTDEFLPPIILNPEGLIKDGDIIIWMNYRTDRAKQILDALINKSYNNFPVISFTDLDIYSFVPIDKRIKTISFLEEETIENCRN